MTLLRSAVFAALMVLLAGFPAIAQTPSDQPEMTSLKSTFVPGDKTIFYDDFTDMSADDAPPHFKVRGAAPELRAGGNVRQLTILQRGSIFPNITTLPKNFTYEAELVAEATNRALTILTLLSKEKQIFQLVTTASPGSTDLQASMRAPYAELGRKRFPTNWKEPVKLALWVQNGRLRVFVNGEKQLDFNQIEMPPIDKVEFAHDFYGANQSLGYRMVRFAESTPDFSQLISSSGRYVTHGILFDTDSDRLKPESAPVIQSIARGLETNPNLKLLIEGHTDSVGSAARNLDLSPPPVWAHRSRSTPTTRRRGVRRTGASNWSSNSRRSLSRTDYSAECMNYGSRLQRGFFVIIP
jgi:OOP family OmpA-OmpF porin